MIRDGTTLIDAKRMVMSDPDLCKDLRKWFEKKGRIPYDTRAYGFDDWVAWLLCTMSERVGVDYPEFPTPRQLVDAVRINAMGDFVAVRAEENAMRDGFEADIDCYVEDGIVYSSIWIKGNDAGKAKEYADRLSGKLNKLGYSAEAYVDEECACEVTVNAQMDFDQYVDMAQMKTNPECLLCGRRMK